MTKKQERLAKANAIDDQLEELTPEQLALLEGFKELTDQQQTIANLKMRGLSQKAIANILNVSPARISQEAKVIRAHDSAQGSEVNQSVAVGMSLGLKKLLMQKAWEVFHNDESKRLAAINTISDLDDKRTKLMMDLGLIKRAAVEHSHDHTVSPILADLTPQDRDAVAAIFTRVSPGIAPTPPSDDDDDFEDTEIITA